MEAEGNNRGNPDGGHSRSGSSSSVSQDSALPTTSPSADIDDDEDATIIESNTRSKSTDGRTSRVNSTTPSYSNNVTSVDRYKHGIRYINDGFIRKITKQNNVTRIHSLHLNNLRDKKIRYIENLQTLINLEHLDLSNNSIEKIDGLKTLKKLKILSLANNFLTTITNLEELIKLENLDLHQNQIHTIPIWFGKKLLALKILNLSNNNISSFDQIAHLRTLYELRELYLQGNPIQHNEYYRLLVISYLPNLQRLDGIVVTDEERKQAKEQFIQQEVQNLLHEIERRDNEYRRLTTQAMNNEQQLGKTSDKLQSIENKSIVQAKEIKELQEQLVASEEQLQRKTVLLHQACEKQCKLEQELAFYKIDLKFDRLDLSKNFKQKTNSNSRNITDSPCTSIKLTNHLNQDEDDTKSVTTDDQQRPSSTIQFQSTEVQRILGRAPEGKFFHAESETLHNEKLLKLAFNMSELIFLQAKQQIIEERLEQAKQANESHAVIEHLSDDLNHLQTETMNKISNIQELKLFLHDIRCDQGTDLNQDLEQVTIELKLDEVVRQHINKLKQQPQQSPTIQPQEYDFVTEVTFEQALTEAISSAGASVHDRFCETTTSSRIQSLELALATNVEQLRAKEISEQEAQKKVCELQLALESEQNQLQERINQIEEMAEREKQRILKHLENEKRFTRDIINKSETMIDQLKRELSSERKRKSEEEKTHDSLRDIYKKILPNQGKNSSKFRKKNHSKNDDDDDDDDENDESRLDGETTVYHKDDPFLASTPRDRSLIIGRNENDDTNMLRRQFDEQIYDESLLDEQKSKTHLTRGTSCSRLPPTPKKQINTKYNSNLSSASYEKTHSTLVKLDPTSKGGADEESDLIYRLHGYVRAGQAYTSALDDLTRTKGNDSGYSSQPTGRENSIENAKLQALLSNPPFPSYNKFDLDPNQFNREYTVGIVTRHNDYHRQQQQPQQCHDPSKVGNITLYPTPEGYMLGPHSVTVSPETVPFYTTVVSPAQSLTNTDSQYFACVNIPPDALSSNRPTGCTRDNQDRVRLQGPVIFRQDTVLQPENVSPVSVKIRSLKFPQVERGTMTDSETIRREIDRATDEIDYLKSKIQRREEEVPNDHQLNSLKETLEQQTKELERVKTIHQEMVNTGRDNQENLLDLSQQIERIHRNVHEHLSPTVLNIVDENSRLNQGKFVPLTGDEPWLCTVPRHAHLEQTIAELQDIIEAQRRALADMKHDNRRLERSLAKKSIKIDALDLAGSRKRSKSIADPFESENLQDDVFILEQQLRKKQRDIVLAQDQLRQMAQLSNNFVHDLKTARQRHTIVKRETKGLEQKIELLTRKLYKLTNETRQAEEDYQKASNNCQILSKEQTRLEKTNDEKRALTLVLDEQLRASVNSFNSLLHSSIRCLQELTAATTTSMDDEFRFTSLPAPSLPLQLNQTSISLAPDEIQRQISHIISENNRLLSRYHTILQQQKQKSVTLKTEIIEKETVLANVKADLDAYNEQLRKNAQELLQDKNVLEELERVKDHKSDKLSELERLLERRHTQEKHAQQEIEQLTNEQQRLKKQYKDGLAEHEQLQHNIEADRQILTEMKGESTRLREQIKTFLDDKETLDETCDLLAKKCEALHNECKEKENTLPELIKQIDEKLTVCKNLEDDIKKLKTDKTRCLEEVTEMKEKIEKKRIELLRSPNEIELEHHNEELKQRIKRHEQDLDRLNRDIDERNRTVNELNTMIAYAKNIMKNVQPNDNRRNYKQTDFPLIDQRHQEENSAYYETKMQRLTKALDEKEQEVRSLHMQLITTKDELLQLQYKVQNQESNAESIKNSMQIELDKLRHWLQIYENRKAMLRPQYHETLKELELKLHEQEMFFRKQIKDIDSEVKRKYQGRTSDDSGFLSDTTVGGEHRISPTLDPTDTSMLREQIQNIFSQHVQELDRYNSKYKTNLSNLKNRLHELENSATATNIRLDS